MAERNAAEFCRRQPGAKLIIDSVDVHFARESAGAHSGLIDVAQAEKNHLPNLDGLTWFVKDIWPRVHEAIPDARFTIIGSNTPAEVRAFGALPGIEVLGFVEDTTAYLDRAAISIAPLRYGGGMKGKVVEAMSCGLPIVTTSVGVQGINAVSGEHCLIADHAADFAEAVTSLLNDPQRAREIGLAGQNHIASKC